MISQEMGSALQPPVSLFVIFLVAIISLALIVFSARRCRGTRRIVLRLMGIWMLIPSLIVVGFVAVSIYSTPEFEVLIGVLGIVLSFVFGVLGSPAAMIKSNPMKIAILFASKGAFHVEIRRGLREQIDTNSTITIDLGVDSTEAIEDELGFLRLLRRTEGSRPDYAVIWAPGSTWAEDPEVVRFANTMYREGGLCIFLENEPPLSIQQRTFTIKHDAEEGGRLQGRLARQFEVGCGKRCLVLLGPDYSMPAQVRNFALREELTDVEGIEFVDLYSWDGSEAVDRVKSFCGDDKSYDIVVCPNDSIALALEDATKDEVSLKWVKNANVLGFNGLPRARACVAENGTVISGTVSIPPSEYGARAGRAIRELSKPMVSWRDRRADHTGVFVLPINEKHVITRGRARWQLYGG